MMKWTTSEQFEEIRELQTNNIALQGSLSRTENSLDQVTLSQDRGEPFVKRLSQRIRNCRNLWMFHRRPRNDREPANSGVSGLPSTSVLNRNRVSAANVTSRNVANSSSRDVFESPFVNSTSVHVERMQPILGASFRFSFSLVPVATSTATSQAAAFLKASIRPRLVQQPRIVVASRFLSNFLSFIGYLRRQQHPRLKLIEKKPCLRR